MKLTNPKTFEKCCEKFGYWTEKFLEEIDEKPVPGCLEVGDEFEYEDKIPFEGRLYNAIWSFSVKKAQAWNDEFDCLESEAVFRFDGIYCSEMPKLSKSY